MSSEAFDADRLTFQVGRPPGAAYDLLARAAANHIGKYLPGSPEVIVENVEGAGGLRLLNLYLETGAKDGSQIAMINSDFVLSPMLNPAETTFDPASFQYLVSFSNYPSYCIATVASGITTFDQLLTENVDVGTTGRSYSYLVASSINRAFGANFNIVSGFAGVSEINLAMARGEIDVFCGITYSSLAVTRQAVEFNVVAEVSVSPFGLVEGAVHILDRVTDPVTKAALGLIFSPNQFFYPVIAHPDTPAETVTILRDAFSALATDAAFLAEVETRGIDLALTGGAEVQEIVNGLLATPPEIQAAARALVE